MTKNQFINELKVRLNGLPRKDIDERILFYSEMIDDRIEDGVSEEEAVDLIGDVEEVAAQIAAGFTVINGEKNKIKSKRKMGAGETVLIAVGFPIWFSLLASAFAVLISLYAVVWALVATLWAVLASFIGCAFGGLVAGIFFAAGGNAITGLAIIGAAIFSAGASILLLKACKAATAGTVGFTKKTILWIVKKIIKRERCNEKQN